MYIYFLKVPILLKLKVTVKDVLFYKLASLKVREFFPTRENYSRHLAQIRLHYDYDPTLSKQVFQMCVYLP